MPSLRRTFSSPSVRANPYCSSATSPNHTTRQGGHGPRRSSGSETANRQVLADIDWWTVHAGQIFTPSPVPPSLVPDTPNDIQTEQQLPIADFAIASVSPVPPATDPNVNSSASPSPTSVWHTAFPGSGAGAFEELVNVPHPFGVSFDEHQLPPSTFVGLSIFPHTPDQRRSASSSTSSIESSPTSSIASLSPVLDLGFADTVPHSTLDYGLEVVPLSFSSPSRPSRQGSLGTRSVSYSYFEMTREREQRFEDADYPYFSPESFTNSVDDLFYQ